MFREGRDNNQQLAGKNKIEDRVIHRNSTIDVNIGIYYRYITQMND